MAMAKIMEPDRRESGTRRQRHEGRGEIVWTPYRAVVIRKHQPVRLVVLPKQVPALILPLKVQLERVDDDCRQWHDQVRDKRGGGNEPVFPDFGSLATFLRDIFRIRTGVADDSSARRSRRGNEAEMCFAVQYPPSHVGGYSS